MPSRRRLAWLIGTAAFVVVAVTLILIVLLRSDRRGVVDAGPDGGLELPVHVESLADATVGDAAGRVATAAPDARAAPPPPRRQITDKELRALQRQHRGMIKYCFDRTAERAPSLVRSKTSIRLELAAGGKIKSVRVNAGDDAELAACLRRMISAWRFSPTLKAQWVTFPIVFAH